MNPARSLGPAVVSLHMKSLWIYLVAPVAGAIAGVLVDRVIRGPGDPRPPAA
jgi:aquaporin NIP